MSQTGGVILCLAHSRFAIYSSPLGYGTGSGEQALLKFALGKALPNFWRVGPKPRLWLAAGVLGNPIFTGAQTDSE